MDNVQALEAQLLALSIGADPINDLIEIDAENRTILLPTTELIFGVATDRSVERKYFVCPKIVGDNIDLSKFGIRINFENAADEKGVYIVDDVKVDGKYIRFSWLLSEQVLKRKGNVTFSVCAVQVEDEVVTVKWNTTTAIGTVLNGLEVEGLYDYEEEEVRDVLQQSLNALEAAKDAKILELQNEGDLQTNLVGAKGALVLDSLPEDYTETNEMAEENSRVKAPAIVESISGFNATANDVSDMNVIGLNVYGKTTQDDIPTPNVPQDLRAACSDGTVTVRLTGKNLLNDAKTYPTTSLRGITADYEGNGIFHVHGTFDTTATDGGIQLATTWFNVPVDPNQYYTFSVKLISGTIPLQVNPYIGTGSDEVDVCNWFSVPIKPDMKVGEVWSAKSRTLGIIEGADRIRRFWIYMYNGTLEEFTTDFRIQVWLEKGEMSTDYEPYIEKSITLNTENGLNGIPVSTGGNYTDENGQQWICDEVDFERGKLIRRTNTINLVDYDSTQITFSDNSSYSDTILRFDFGYMLGTKVKTEILCNRFPYKFAHGDQISIVRASECISSHSMSDVLSVFIDKSRLSSPDVTGFVNYLTSNDVIVTYALNAPIETTLSDEEILAFKSLTTNYPFTTMFNNQRCHTKLTYAADTKLYIDNKFAELQAAITS